MTPYFPCLQVSEAAERKEKADIAYEKWLQVSEANYRQRGYMYCEQPKPSYCNSSNWIGPCEDESGDVTSQSSSARTHSHCRNSTPQCQISIADQHMCIKLRPSHNHHGHYHWTCTYFCEIHCMIYCIHLTPVVTVLVAVIWMKPALWSCDLYWLICHACMCWIELVCSLNFPVQLCHQSSAGVKWLSLTAAVPTFSFTPLFLD